IQADWPWDADSPGHFGHCPAHNSIAWRHGRAGRYSTHELNKQMPAGNSHSRLRDTRDCCQRSSRTFFSTKYWSKYPSLLASSMTKTVRADSETLHHLIRVPLLACASQDSE